MPRRGSSARTPSPASRVEEAYTSLWERPGRILHVELAQRADVAVVAPATANAIARLANGLADDLLTSTLLEFDGPLVIAPAMHAGMWASPATAANVGVLQERGVRFVGPVVGALAHGDEGMGRMSEPADIRDAVAAVTGPHDLHDRRVLVTAGPTHEPIDPVRFLGNRSSGKMGIAVAAAARARGADVTLVLGPGTIAPPPGLEVVHVRTADEMREAVLERAATADVVVMAAAVADFRAEGHGRDEAAQGAGRPGPGPRADARHPRPSWASIAATARSWWGSPRRPGEVETSGRDKLARKHLDLLVANLVGREGTGFGADTNEAAIVSAHGPRAADAPVDEGRARGRRLRRDRGPPRP